MSSILRRTALTTICAVTLFSSQALLARDLTVVGFGGATQEAFDKAYFKPYAAQSGKPVVQDTYDGGIAKQKAMVQAGNPTWDVVQMDENEMALACEQGLLEPLDRSRLSSAADIAPDKFAPCGVGAIVWSEVMTYDHRKFPSEGPQTWADFWNVKKWPGKRGLRKQARMTLEIALMADGVKPADVYTVLATKAGQDRAFAKLDEIKPHIQWWETGAQPLEWLSSGSIAVTAAYNGRIAIANQQGAHFPLIWNQQLYSMDYWTIIKGTPNLKESYALLDYMLSPKAQGAFVQAIPYGIVNGKAQAALDKQTLNNLPTAPANLENALLLDTPFWVNYEEDLMARFTNWAAK
ncbi:putative spermidine/putrescine transport system substrate-binding protein [Pseudomonas sp. NFACC32-1]|uniref:ABC transporter substrate-binding protein n=1 Tax=Pseudomonas TaxID=286 RepID=UPI0008769D1C|nr:MULTISPECIES: ABC transporter substrate-binding protein [Pseudomonas]MDB6442625.1 ABC transporter substrate-binding protein [Pseudomonas sp. 21TX0197]MDT8909268.1 ABC transporter substrate-binding protein [Pseudomonas prosekii]NHN68302.1 ABC transporter substrate-binding protein [Pseudomonas fluorescens]ROO39687.1 spermidine/putrescine ABC transporter substrate-binding protein [Pseudomonas sp. AF76]ROO40056.1 spermidine/putrescine ABC transporter substrate-binding protein [Pseudomonas sp. 7